MAITTTCPSCGRQFAVPPGFRGGTITCPHADCAQAFEARPATPRAATAAAMVATGPRPPGARPELLDKLPANPLLSPPMVAAGGVVVLLYGLVMFPVLSAWKHRPRPPEPEPLPPPTVALAPALPAPPPEPPKPAETRSQAPPKGTDKPKDQPKVEVKPKTDRPRNDNPNPKPDPTKPAPPPPKVEIARAVPAPTKPAPVAPADVLKGESWGVLSGPPGDCQFRPDANSLTIAVPGTLHVLSPELKTTNSPRLLTDVRGDFVAQVKVARRILPGTTPLKNFPFTFQGAGLLVWQDEHNYLRLERSSFFTAEHKRLHQVLVEFCRDGKTAPATLRDARDADITLKLDRRGSEIRCSYSPDEGRTWLEVKRQSVAFPADVYVGVSASNVSPKPFQAHLEDFELSGPERPSKNP